MIFFSFSVSFFPPKEMKETCGLQTESPGKRPGPGDGKHPEADSGLLWEKVGHGQSCPKEGLPVNRRVPVMGAGVRCPEKGLSGSKALP